jgi:apolipoprotein N-acyltransferase
MQRLRFRWKPPAEWRQRLSALALTALFGLLFYLGYYVWWPAVFFVVTPLARLAERRCGLWVCFCVLASTTATWLVVYAYFSSFSLTGLVIVSLYHGLIVALVVASASWWRRRSRLPMACIFPVVWAGGEFWRMSGAIGMPFGLLAQPAYEQLWMIQVSDLGGAYVLSFAMAMAGGLLADWIREQRAGRGLVWKRVRVAVLVTATMWSFVAVYGVYRLEQSKRTMTAGPVLAIVQNDVPTLFDGSLGAGADPNVSLQDLFAFSSKALAASPRPELVVWPESPSGFPPLNRSWVESPAARSDFEHQVSVQFSKRILGWVRQNEVPVLLGSLTKHGEETRNSALHFDPKRGQLDPTKDKIHLFPIGEYLPLRGTFIHPWLEKYIGNGRTDWTTAGTRKEIFSIGNRDGERWRYVVPICNEIIFPADVGTFLPADASGGKPVNFVVNLASNAGFLRSYALIHNHILLPFRAVEGRLGIARSSNSGISCFIKPTGQIYGAVMNAKGQIWTGKGAPELELVAQAIAMRIERADELSTDPALRKTFTNMVAEIGRLRAGAGITGQSVRPVYVDSRRTLYSRTGDLFGKLLLALLIIGVGGAFSTRPRRIKLPYGRASGALSGVRFRRSMSWR